MRPTTHTVAAIANAPAPLSADDLLLEEYCQDIDEWPERWELINGDYRYGQIVLDQFKPFMLYLIHNHIQGDSLRQHFANLWLLGQELVRSSHMNPLLRQQAVAQLLEQSVDDEGGPICRELDNDTARAAFDATCRMLHHYLAQPH
jgi:hypothetical protein